MSPADRVVNVRTDKRGVTPALVRLVDTAAQEGPATPDEVERHLQAGFFWLDLEDASDEEVAAFCQRLHLPAGTVDSVVHGTPRSSLAMDADSVRAVLPAAVDTRPSPAWLEASYLTLVLTEQFLLTVHSAPCAPLQDARHQYRALDKGARADGALLLFVILDVLVGSFGTQLLELDDRLGEIQLGMLRGAAPEVHDELVHILGILTDSIQELAWYGYDLAEVAEMVDELLELPGRHDGSRKLLDRHRRRIDRMSENLKEIREEATGALNRYSEFVAGRQARVINTLTIVATVFLPLSFLTGYFGMNFATLTGHVETKLWQFILLGLLLPIASAALSLLLIHRLERRLGLRHL